MGTKMDFSDESIAATANQLRSQFNDFTSSDMLMRKRARMVLRAAAPYLMAGVWDDGFTAGCSEHMKQREDPTHPITRTNPYKPEVRDLHPHPSTPGAWVAPEDGLYRLPSHSMHGDGEYFYACEACSGLPDGERQ